MLTSNQVGFAAMLMQFCFKNVHSCLAALLGWIFKLVSGTQVQQTPVGEISRLKTRTKEQKEGSSTQLTTPSSVNYHFTRQCNYKCGFCFHTAKTSFVLPIEEAKRGLHLLKEAGMEKVNSSGGEPFLHKRGHFLGELVRLETWFQKYGDYLDILAVSCDSFNEDTNKVIGRGQGRKSHLDKLHQVRDWCRDYKVAFKINSVINTYNVDEDMTEQFTALNPVRWKVQLLHYLSEGENAGESSLREAEKFIISDQQFQDFLDRHQSVKCLVPESNQKMRDSYLILDEYMRFLDCREGRKDPSKSILDVGVEEAIKFSGFDEKMFLIRGGKYMWSKANMKLEW
uniref:Radical SAM core domain-containing protein n=1 Tax=Sinocyclocheilus grahami TaxID=75366 RepID=A0A672SKG7_SINGR